MESKQCLSCKKKVANDKGTATFLCPKCSEYTIVRCSNCRANATKYSCPACHFMGPN